MNSSHTCQLADMISRSKRTVFFGGAGVSTESGVRDYRSEDGIYTSVSVYGYPPETILSRSFFESKPEIFYDFYYRFFLTDEPQPNAAHRALAELEKSGRLAAVITQNIDGLHQKAGSRNVFELHGTSASYHCVKCGKKYDRTLPKAAAGKIPYCGCGGILKPDVVLYEEPLDEKTLLGAIDEIRKADLMIVGGTSLAVYPAAGLLRYFSGGVGTALINKSETPWDKSADLVIRDKIGETFAEVMKILGGGRD